MWLHRVKLGQYLGARNPSKSSWFLSSFSSYSALPRRKSKLAPLQEKRMIDRFRICTKGGDGGNGCSSYRRSRHDRHGKPDGANGGRGGDVILECSPTVWDFSSLPHHINAGKGGHGGSKNKIGSRGADKVVQVPVGTVIHLVEGEVPDFVSHKSSEDLYPWETSGTLADDSSEPDLQSDPASPNGDCGALTPVLTSESSSNAVIRGEESVNMGRYTQASSAECFPHETSEGDREDSLIYEEESIFEGSDVDDSASEEEGEEVLKSKDDMQYNVAELTERGQQIIVARGGEGGFGNISSRYASSLKAKQDGVNKGAEIIDDEDQPSPSIGSAGSEAVFVLELKSIADVGLVGMPNAGKSTLLGAISRAQPAVGHYAFTTLRPNIGKLNYEDFFTATVADIPGLIKGAHENRGLGHAFLRHIERTRVLVYVLDLAATLDGQKGLPPWQQLKDLVLELEFYREGLSKRPSLVVANKIDEVGAEEVFEELKRRVQGVPVYPVCAVLEEGVAELKAGLKMLVNGEESHRLSVDGILTD